MFKNILANIIGRFWSIFSNYLFIPLYIKILGLESYSFISFSFVIFGIISIIDSGLTSTLSKEFASQQKTTEDKLKLLSTLEYFYLILIAALIAVFFLFSGSISEKWLNLNSLNPEEAAFYLKILGVGLSFQLLSNFYMGGMIGLENQILANKYQIAFGVLKNGVVILIILAKSSLLYFFLWQTVVTVFYVVFLRYKLQSYILGKKYFSLHIKFDKTVFLYVWKFAVGMLVISIVASINTQLDKIVISKLLSIDQLGIYNIAGTLSQSLFVLVTPISMALLPRFTALYSTRDNTSAGNLFHKFLLILSVLIFSVSANLIFGSTQIIWAWTGNAKIAEVASKYVAFMIFGNSLLVLMMLPFDIAIANSYTKLNNIVGILSICFTIPAYLYMVRKFGPLGAAISWVSLQIIVAPIYFHLINKRFLNIKDSFSMFVMDILKPMLFAFVLAGIFSFFSPGTPNRIIPIIWFVGCVLITTLCNMLFVLPRTEIKIYKQFIFNYFNSLISK